MFVYKFILAACCLSLSSKILAQKVTVQFPPSETRPLGKAVQNGSLSIIRPPILYIRPVYDINGQLLDIGNDVLFINDSEVLPDFKKPISNSEELPDFGAKLLKTTEILKSRDQHGRFFIDYGSVNAGVLPLASENPETSAKFPPFVR